MTTRTTSLALGLFLAWVANDIEEAITMQEDSRRALAAAPTWLPIPRELRANGVSQAHVMTGICLMGGLMAAATVDGMRSGGRSRLFQTALFGFGIHGFGHLAASAVARRWTSGSLTSPTVVIPYWLWASDRLRRGGVDPLGNVSWPFVAATPVVLAVAHGSAWALRRSVGIRRPLLED